MLLLALPGCIPNYDDFLGAKDSAHTDQSDAEAGDSVVAAETTDTAHKDRTEDDASSDVALVEATPETVYPTHGILEFFEPYGDDNVKCQGFKEPPLDEQKIDHCYFEVAYNQERAFSVLYMEDNLPVPSQEIEWELVTTDDPNIATLDAKSSGTNGEGIATVTVTTKDIKGQFAIKATAVSAKFSVPPLYFDVVVVPKQVEPLTVKFKHEGAASFDVVKGYLFLQNDGKPLCKEIDPTNLPQADKASPEFNDIGQSWKIPSFADLTPDNPLMYTVIGTASKAGGPLVAFGCDDASALVEFGKSMVVVITMHDVPPKYKGKYEVINHFDMISALPDDIEKVVNIVIDFFNNPTAGIMEFTCQLDDNDSLKTLCEYFFNDPDNPSIDDLTSIGDIASQVINAILYGLLKDNVGGDILFTGKDVGNILRDIEIHSTITIKAEPDTTGFIPADQTEEEWHTVSFQWTLGEDCNPIDPQCGLKSYSFNAIGQDVVIGHFDAHLEGFTEGTFDQLVINAHSLNFKYGTFLNFVIEKLVLPEVAGDGADGLPVVDSWEKLLGALVGGKGCLVQNDCCEVFATNMANQAGAWVDNVMEAGCNALIPLASGYLREFLLSLDADAGETFTLATKAGMPCAMYDMDNNAEIDAWGKKDPPELRCTWDAKFKLVGIDVLLDADFWGLRQQ